MLACGFWRPCGFTPRPTTANCPEQLDDITEVPIPRNPFDDQPFNYRRDGNRAVLGLPARPAGPAVEL